MYSKTINENEYLYSLILFFRKSIPNNEYFYIIIYRGFPFLNKEAKPVGIFAQIDYICVR